MKIQNDRNDRKKTVEVNILVGQWLFVIKAAAYLS